MNKTLNSLSVCVFEGDGIGPEIMSPVVDVLEKAVALHGAPGLRFEAVPAGAGHYRNSGEALPQASLDVAGSSDAILLSAMGIPDVRYEDGTEITPQIDLRFAFDLYAGVRPVKIWSRKACPLKDERACDIDFVLIRESTEGLFAHMHEGQIVDDEYATETMRITRKTSEKLFDFGFDLARKRKETGRGKGRFTCVDKANVFRSFWFFRSIFEERAKLNADIQADSAYVDAVAMWMVQRPWEFDVMVTENMFGDILSDLGAGLVGSLGLAPSADIGDNHAVFQPCHGSAPDIAGKGIANPLAMALSGAMMLEWLGHKHEIESLCEAGRTIEKAIEAVLAEDVSVTGDLGGKASTKECAHAIIEIMSSI